MIKKIIDNLVTLIFISTMSLLAFIFVTLALLLACFEFVLGRLLEIWQTK